MKCSYQALLLESIILPYIGVLGANFFVKYICLYKCLYGYANVFQVPSIHWNGPRSGA